VRGIWVSRGWKHPFCRTLCSVLNIRQWTSSRTPVILSVVNWLKLISIFTAFSLLYKKRNTYIHMESCGFSTIIICGPTETFVTVVTNIVSLQSTYLYILTLSYQMTPKWHANLLVSRNTITIKESEGSLTFNQTTYKYAAPGPHSLPPFQKLSVFIVRFKWNM
jgi:hypothetical protein